ncbi:MAG: GGDEF domain-containing protein [Chloroflexota bacterium]
MQRPSIRRSRSSSSTWISSNIFNDRLGHGGGDQILRIVAQRIQHQVRAEDFVGRLGGDEFIVILPGVCEASLTIEQDIYINITASIGRSHATDASSCRGCSLGRLSQYPADGTSSEALVNDSDAAMYRVKRNGGNALEHYQADHGAAA